MNIKITHNWLLEYLDTDATPQELQKYLSLCGPSIEKISKVGDDYVYDIEITSNRIDMASVMGIAREASAILPRFGKKALFKHKQFSIPKLKENNLKLVIEDKNGLTNRILAVILDGVRLTDSPTFIKERLEMAGIRSLNNLVDITNYVMLEIGHPTHVFDYDRIKTAKFVFRKAKAGEKLTTLDGKTFTLKGNEVVIDDGTGRIVDLPSIMGTYNSVVTGMTKRIIFFIDNLDPVLVRKASMSHGIRTVAATYNEKSPDRELAHSALVRALELLEEYASPQSMSKIIDIYPHPKKPKHISVSPNFITSRIGISLSENVMTTILQNLGFKVKTSDHSLHVTVPSWRSDDVKIPEDIIEEVARIYGYYNLPDDLQPMVFIKQPKEIELMLELQSKIKYFLKHIGLHEVMNYSMISKDLIEKAQVEIKEHLKLKNTISEEIEYMRSHLLPSLFMNIKQNEGKAETLKFFEIAKTYKKRVNDLPDERYKLGIVVNTTCSDLKGIVDAILEELHVTDFEAVKTDYPYMSKQLQGEIFKEKDWIVKYGEFSQLQRNRYGIKNDVYVAIFDLESIVKYYKPMGQYVPINPFAEVKLDLTIESDPKKLFVELQKKAMATSPLLQKIELVDTYKNKLNLRFYFSSPKKNITEEEAKKELENIKKAA